MRVEFPVDVAVELLRRSGPQACWRLASFVGVPGRNLSWALRRIKAVQMAGSVWRYRGDCGTEKLTVDLVDDAAKAVGVRYRTFASA